MSTLVMAVNDASTSSANNVYIPYRLGIGQTAPPNKLHVYTNEGMNATYSRNDNTTVNYKGVYGHKYVNASGSSYYGEAGTQNGVFGYYQHPSYGDSYRFGVHGHFYHTLTTLGWGWRCGGVIGSYTDAGANRGWGALGYNNSSGTFYGVYGSTGYASGAGLLRSFDRTITEAEGVGIGGFGGLFGSITAGGVYGSFTKGTRFLNK